MMPLATELKGQLVSSTVNENGAFTFRMVCAAVVVLRCIFKIIAVKTKINLCSPQHTERFWET